jgi:hypothetical protein
MALGPRRALPCRRYSVPVSRRSIPITRFDAFQIISPSLIYLIADMGLEAIAYHEAGHAVAAWSSRFKLIGASIEPQAGSSGRLQFKNPLKRIRLDLPGDSPRTRIRVENAVITCLAGPLAQRRYRPRAYRHWHGSDDHARALDLAIRLCGSGPSTAAYLKWLNIRTKQLLDVHWASVERVANGLLNKGTLDADDLLSLMLPPSIA